MPANPIAPTVDYDADGVQHGFLRLPWSRNESAWGNLMIPITVIRNGEGPTALLTGASHGDEYEGPVALMDLARTLQAEQVRGRVIIIPFLNYPAFRAGTRLSPVDGANMNRIFPGRPDGTVSHKIADYLQCRLLPLADFVLDFHSGGRTLDFVPFAAAHVLPDKAHEARCHAARDAFGAPYSVTMLEIDAVGMLDTAAEEMGKVFVTTELGGAGTATARSVGIARRGLRNVLVHAGIVEGEVVQTPSIRLDMPSIDCFSFAETEGLVEPCVDLGEPVEAGTVLVKVHSILRTGQEPVEYRARMSGILAARHAPGLAGPGDCLAVVATLVD
ncbi:MAG TPA: N(2)-acetyl-L-2,4-diaminobutanoate deacetylase DoeB [Devosiaceae bacterium]|jgi:N-alpha-acetyl-L-2,4-diaminobutyrate deacetylase|nr:N(2)-acetyl-L-2,4-diaminobutanoate deacetylase DoeB [Devosiaceae bacterium]